MKTIFSCYIDSEVISACKTIAGEVRAPLGDVLGLFLAQGVKTANIEALKAWQEKRRAPEGPNGPLKKNERLVLATVKAYGHDDADGIRDFRINTNDVAAKAGLPRKATLLALASLEAMKLIRHMSTETDEYGEEARDAWGRLSSALWCTEEEHQAWIERNKRRLAAATEAQSSG